MRSSDLEGAEHAAVRPIDVAQRSAANLAILVLLAVLFLLGLANARVAAAAGITVEEGVLAAGVFLVFSGLAFLTFNCCGPTSRVYRFFDYAEGFALSGSLAYLIQASGAVSFFWLFYGIQVLATAMTGISFLYTATLSVTPLALVGIFATRGELVWAWYSGIAGVCGLFVYIIVARVSGERDAALRREATLREQLGHAWVARERARISRDLHDNVATELAALVWKVREVSDAVPSGPHARDIGSVAERLRSVIGDLRKVVLALREPDVGFRELTEMIQRRCRELCSPSELDMTVSGELDADELSVLQTQISPICFELANNAGRHAGASRVSLELLIGDAVRIAVGDDGRGLSGKTFQRAAGGLRGVRQRAEALGGTVKLEPRTKGSLIVVVIPRPLRVGKDGSREPGHSQVGWL